MLESALVELLLGFVLGILAGLGIGGGSLLMLWLTLILQVEHTTARAINLMFFLAAAGGVCILRLKRGSFNLKTVLPAMVGGCIAAGICSWIGTLIEQNLLRKTFGILLLLTGLRELFYRPRKAK